MALPKSVVKIKKNGVEYTSSVDRAQYTIHELTRAALKDCGKLIAKRTRQKVKRQTGRFAKNTQYWVRWKQKIPNLQVGFKPGGFYGIFQELGAENTPKIGALRNSTLENIDEIRKIQGQYLSAIENESKALRLINESEEVSDD